SNKVFKEVARIMMSTVTGKALSSTSEFTISVADERGAYVVTMLPKKKEIRQMFSRIELVFDKTGSMISEINIFEKNGDSTNIKITNISTNKAVDESNFAIPE
ncbi:MAG: outer membrane lipoprotein carrier protein LolA, partial [Muribaculaceae bacterium]|nr:outer membrane lipoprotein carrier protein LolA [Muribaculaceae bacterium]